MAGSRRNNGASNLTRPGKYVLTLRDKDTEYFLKDCTYHTNPFDQRKGHQNVEAYEPFETVINNIVFNIKRRDWT